MDWLVFGFPAGARSEDSGRAHDREGRTATALCPGVWVLLASAGGRAAPGNPFPGSL